MGKETNGIFEHSNIRNMTDWSRMVCSGGHMISGYAGVTPMKPGSASFPLLGVEVAILNPQVTK